jgi:hypothetical protein
MCMTILRRCPEPDRGPMERRTEGSVETVVGDFDAADELLFAAENAQLPDVGRVRVQRSGRHRQVND